MFSAPTIHDMFIQLVNSIGFSLSANIGKILLVLGGLIGLNILRKIVIMWFFSDGNSHFGNLTLIKKSKNDPNLITEQSTWEKLESERMSKIPHG